jgi:hypothetical protein
LTSISTPPTWMCLLRSKRYVKQSSWNRSEFEG